MEKKPIGYFLRSIEIVKLRIGQKTLGLNINEFHFDITAEARVNPVKKILFMVVSIITKDIDNKGELAEIVTAIGFEIENFDEVLIKDTEDETYIIPEELEIPLRIISISTTRGIMFSEFKGTYLSRAILPIVPQIITRQDMP